MIVNTKVLSWTRCKLNIRMLLNETCYQTNMLHVVKHVTKRKKAFVKLKSSNLMNYMVSWVVLHT